jgi:hypothetical protein
MEDLLAGPALDEELDAAIKRLFFFLCEVTGGQLAPQTVIVQTFAAQRVFAARGVRAGAVFAVDADTGTLVNLSHANLRALTPRRVF